MKQSHICSGSPTDSRLEHSETKICRGNEQCEKSRQSAMGSLLTDSRIDLTFHSATVRMSEGNAGANEALRVEFSTFLKLYVGLRANQGNRLLGEFTSNFAWSSAQAKETGFLGSLPQTLRGAGAPRKLRDKPNPSSHGHGCCVSGSGPRAY